MFLLPFLLYLALVALNLLDGISTWHFVRPGHFHREANPLARWMFRKLGITRGIILAELLWIGLISLIFFLTWSMPVLGSVLIALLAIGIVVFAYVVIDNFRFLRRIRQRESAQAAKEETAC